TPDGEDSSSDTEINLDAEDMSAEDLDLLSVEDLEELLEMSISEEKYELAVNIRDALLRKKNS
ncbi:MAG: hypothetical protein PHU68_08180, partial [Paludibacter sp.]|nr:hypothetical protein [Paludibacter sp.]